MDAETTFGQWVRQRRKALDLSREELAQRAHCSAWTLAKIEADAYRPSKEAAHALLTALEPPPAERDDLLHWARAAPGTPWRMLVQQAPPAAPGAGAPKARGTSARTAPPHQLRPPVADFVGREDETEQLVMALETAARSERGAIIGAVQGMGGVGKTELAYYVAHQVRQAFPDAQIVLTLRGPSAAPLTAEQAVRAVIHALTPDAKLPDDLPALEQHYRTALHGQRALILADDACDAAQVRSLIPPTGSALLITSRTRFTLPGMTTIDLAPLGDEAAITLLRSICARLTRADACTIARACGQLPLALRISGGILRNDPAVSTARYIQQLADLRQRLHQLHDPDEPQHDVATSLTLSYARLDVTMQRVFRGLGVIVADFATDLARAVVATAAEEDVDGQLRRLLRRNLVMYDAARARWRLHDLVRDVARRQLEEHGEVEVASWRYARAAIQLAQEIGNRYLAGGDEVLAALERFDIERPHIDAARRWLTDQAGTPAGDALLIKAAVATRQIGTLRYDMRRDHIPQLAQAYAATQRMSDPRSEGVLLNSLGIAYYYLGDVRTANTYFALRLSQARSLGDQHGEAEALGNLGLACANMGNFSQAIAYYEQDLAIARTIGDQRGEGKTLNNLGNAYCELGETRRAIDCYTRRLMIAHDVGDRRGEGITLDNLGNAYTELGEPQRAIAYHHQALAIAAELGDRRGEGQALSHLGLTYVALGVAQQAITCCTRALAIVQELNDQREEGYILCNLGRAHALHGDSVRAIGMFTQAAAIFAEVSDRRGAAECNWHFGLALAHQGDRQRALPLLRACVAYEEEIGHIRATEYAALLARLEAGDELPARRPANRQPAIRAGVGTGRSSGRR